eukprot:4941405-Amphidinium_carterae.1
MHNGQSLPKVWTHPVKPKKEFQLTQLPINAQLAAAKNSFLWRTCNTATLLLGTSLLPKKMISWKDSGSQYCHLPLSVR